MDKHIPSCALKGAREEEAEIRLDAVKATITRLESELAIVRAKTVGYLE